MKDTKDPFGLDEFEDRLPLDTLLRTMAKPIARYTVYYLYQERRDSLDHVADVVTGWINAPTDAIATPGDRDRTRSLLYHVYLPMLDSLNVLRFDPENGTIVAEDVSTTMESFVEWLRDVERSDSIEDVF